MRQLYEVKEVTDKQFQEFKQRYGHDSDIGNLFDDNFCAVSIPKESIMLIYANLFANRKRLTVFHESGHEALPGDLTSAVLQAYLFLRHPLQLCRDRLWGVV